MKISVEISELLLDDLQRTGFISREQRGDLLLLRELVSFLVLENARDLPTAMRFSLHLQGLREQKHREWQEEQAARNYYQNDITTGA